MFLLGGVKNSYEGGGCYDKVFIFNFGVEGSRDEHLEEQGEHCLPRPDSRGHF